MNTVHLATTGFLVFWATASFSQSSLEVDLPNLLKNKGIAVFNRALSPLDEAAHLGIRLSKDEGEGVAWLKGIEFSDGVLEFEVRGEDIKQHSFVGMAFHGQNDSTFDAIYLRPFQFKSPDEILRKRAIQYISLPDYPWRRLREKFPDQYEHAIEPAPDPNAWVRVRIVIQGSTISTYINGNKQASLVVEKVNRFTSGSVGFYVADTSGGDFANLTITKTN
jgi:hypothetical protein